MRALRVRSYQHSYLGAAKEQTVTIQPKGQAKVDVKINAPIWRLYANEMVENPYTRYGIIDALPIRVLSLNMILPPLGCVVL